MGSLRSLQIVAASVVCGVSISGCTMLAADGEVETSTAGDTTATDQPVTDGPSSSATPSTSLATTMPAATPTSSSPSNVASPGATPATTHTYTASPGAPQVTASQELVGGMLYFRMKRKEADAMARRECPKLIPAGEVGIRGVRPRYTWGNPTALECQAGGRTFIVRVAQRTPTMWMSAEKARQTQRPDEDKTASTVVAGEVDRIAKQHKIVEPGVLCTVATQELTKAGFGTADTPQVVRSRIKNQKRDYDVKSVAFCKDHRIVEVTLFAQPKGGPDVVSDGQLIELAKKTPGRAWPIIKARLEAKPKK